jgi:hypothetical protein
MNPADNIERAIEEMHLTTDAATDQRILSDSFAALEAATRSGVAHKPAVRTITLRSPVVSLGAAAAAVIMIVALFLNYAPGKSLDLRSLYMALGEVTSLSIERYTPSEDVPYQQEWASQTLNASMVSHSDVTVLWDLAHAARKTKRSGSNTARSGMIPEERFEKIRYWMSHNFGLVPFPDINHMPDGVQWTAVTDPDVLSVVPDADVYDLVWTNRWPETEVRRQRYFVSAETNLPTRIEVYARAESQSEFRFLRYAMITYLTDSEVEDAVTREFGSVSDVGSSNDPVYMGTPESFPRILP